jgi:hypothetical protein
LWTVAARNASKSGIGVKGDRPKTVHLTTREDAREADFASPIANYRCKGDPKSVHL